MHIQQPEGRRNWLRRYYDEIKKIPILRREEEVELAQRIHAGDQGAFDKLIRSNLRFVVKIAQCYKNQGLPLEDLVNEGNLGLIEAAKRFDETRGFKFISFAVWWIRQSIQKALTEQSRIVRIPLNKVSDINKTTQTYLRLAQEYKRKPTINEVAESMNQPVEKISELLLSSKYSLSLDAQYDENPAPLENLIENQQEKVPGAELEEKSLKKKLDDVLGTLTPQESEIIKLAFGIDCERPLSIEEISNKLNLAANKVRRIKERALKRLQHSKRSNILRDLLRN